jgi:hypothetical protein
MGIGLEENILWSDAQLEKREAEKAQLAQIEEQVPAEKMPKEPSQIKRSSLKIEEHTGLSIKTFRKKPTEPGQDFAPM